ncbi:MAG: hypothetical protein AB7P22_04460 [Vicinamibacterales bacterium]
MVRAWFPALVMAGGILAAQSQDPFAFYAPSLDLTARDREQLEAGDAIVKMLPYGERELAIFSAVQTDVTGDRLAGWVRSIEELKRSPSVPAIGRFSEPPRLQDLDGMVLEREDLDALHDCRPGSCDVKLSGREIEDLQRAIQTGGTSWEESAQQTFRKLMLTRVETYRSGGLDALDPYHDQDEPTPLAPEFDALLASSPYLERRAPALTSYLRGYPRPEDEDIESFLYWSKEALGGKPVISLSHVTISRPAEEGAPEVLVASRQFYATHYLTGSLALTAIAGGDAGRPRFLVYVNRSRIDVLGGFFGGLARRIIERRLRSEATGVVEDLRRRLESRAAPATRD